MFFTITANFSEPLWLGEIFPTASNTLLQVYRIYLPSTLKAFGGTGNVNLGTTFLKEYSWCTEKRRERLDECRQFGEMGRGGSKMRF